MTNSHWQIVGASVQGTSHEKNNMPCQDAHYFWLLPNGILLIAVADGAGSAEHSATGAELAVTTIVTHLRRSLEENIPDTESHWQRTLAEAFQHTQQTIQQLAQKANIATNLFATTLTCAIVAQEWLLIGQIGDGTAVAQADEGELFVTLPPQHGEYANETAFLTMPNALDHVEIKGFTQPITALAVMTDGLTRLALNLADNTPHAPFFEPLLTFTAQITDPAGAQNQLSDFLASGRVCSRTDDDKTLVLAVRNDSSTVGLS